MGGCCSSPDQSFDVYVGNQQPWNQGVGGGGTTGGTGPPPWMQPQVPPWQGGGQPGLQPWQTEQVWNGTQWVPKEDSASLAKELVSRAVTKAMDGALAKELAASAINRAINQSLAKELSQRVIQRATEQDKATTAGVSRGLAYNVVNNAGSSSQKGIVAEPPDPKLSLSLTSMNSQSQPEDGNWFQQLTNRISQGSKELTEGVKGLLSQRGPAPTQGSGVSATHRGLVDNNRDGLQA